MGGRAFPDVTPVDRDAIPKIIEQYMRAMGHPSYGLLGSTGKKPVSGDIDIAINERIFSYDRLVQVLIAWLGAENVSTQGKNLSQIYTRYQRKGVCHQVDIMVGNVQLLQFTHFAPAPDTSAYGGSHRTELIKAVAKANSPHRAYYEKQMVARVGYTLHHDKGLTYSARWCPPRKDGEGYTKKMVEVTTDTYPEFKKQFPCFPAVAPAVSVHPPEIAYKLFRTTDDRALNTYERVCEIIRSREEYQNLRDLIWTLYTQRLDEIKLPHPERLI